MNVSAPSREAKDCPETFLGAKKREFQTKDWRQNWEESVNSRDAAKQEQYCSKILLKQSELTISGFAKISEFHLFVKEFWFWHKKLNIFFLREFKDLKEQLTHELKWMFLQHKVWLLRKSYREIWKSYPNTKIFLPKE